MAGLRSRLTAVCREVVDVMYNIARTQEGSDCHLLQDGRIFW